ncbi:MAG: MBL fold metallo-hydrolase [Abyssibacter sp.]|jgi:sulfur dioxygenase|uniref:MBL fold metallo-hydrolase n=1 Tax=Abyssibacter sp. TaxID=2320200 RepID=UPI00321A613D
MIFRQLFDSTSGTYSYLLASRAGGEALLVDPVLEQMPAYLQLLDELGVRLVHALDTHTHADHVTALGALRDATQCTTVMGAYSQADCVNQLLSDDETLNVDGIELRALYTPGHTNESFSYWIGGAEPAVLTGDVLLIRGTGRTDFQGGDAGASWDSITQRLFPLGDQTLVYPGHDYKGWTRSTIGEERRFNPRLAGRSREEYIEIMAALNLPDPTMMDIAVPANLACGQPPGGL